MKKTYNSPVIETKVIFDVAANDFSVFGRCWGLNSPNEDGTYTHASGGQCKD